MRILICTPEYPPHYSSGIGNVVKCLKNELEKNGLSITICSTLCSDVELGNGAISKKFVNIRSIYVSFYWHKAINYVKENVDNYDLVWAHDPMPHFLLSFPKNKNLIITFHTIHSYYIRNSKYPKCVSLLVQLFEKFSINNLAPNTKIVAVSRKVAEELVELGLSMDRIKYIPNGVDVDIFKPSYDKKHLREKLNLPIDGIILLSVGKIKEQKRPLLLIDVFSAIENCIDNINLVIIGRGHLLDDARKHAENNGLNKVMFLGYVDDTRDYYAAADYYIMTSIYEGQPLTLLEAMSSGLPCIVSDIPNLQIVNDANCGIVLNFDDIPVSAHRIFEYISKNNFEQAENSRNYCLQKASWKRIAEEYALEFNSILR